MATTHPTLPRSPIHMARFQTTASSNPAMVVILRAVAFAAAPVPPYTLRRRPRSRAVCTVHSEGFAMDAFRFALSPPALGAAALTLSALLATQLRFAPQFTARDPNTQYDTDELFLVRWTARSAGCVVEAPDGQALVMRHGENLLKLSKREQCSAMCRTLQAHPEVEGGSVLRVNGDSVRVEMRFPKSRDTLDAPQVSRDRQDSEEVWNDYLRMFLDKIDVEWVSFSREKLELGRGIILDNGDGNCKLCNGAGRKKCYHCQGMSATKQRVKCSICNEVGFLPCEWCSK